MERFLAGFIGGSIATFLLRDVVWSWFKKPIIPVDCYEAILDLHSFFTEPRDGFDNGYGFTKDDVFVLFHWCDETEYVVISTAQWLPALEELGLFRTNAGRLVFRHDWKTKFRLSLADNVRLTYNKCKTILSKGVNDGIISISLCWKTKCRSWRHW